MVQIEATPSCDHVQSDFLTGFAGPTEPLAMGMGSSCEWQERYTYMIMFVSRWNRSARGGSLESLDIFF